MQALEDHKDTICILLIHADPVIVHGKHPFGAAPQRGYMDLRRFGTMDGALLYTHEVAVDDSGLRPHMSARLLRIGG